MGRVGVEEANPEIAFEIVERTKKRGEGFATGGIDGRGWIGAVAAALPFVHAEVGSVLRDEVDFLHALRDEALCFLDDGILGARTMLAPDFRDDTEGAGMITAFGNLEVSHMLWSEPKAGCGVVRDIARLGGDGVEGALFGITFEGFAHDTGDVGDLVETDEGVDFGKKSGKVLLEPLREATCDDDFLLLTRRVFLTGVDSLDDGADGFVLGDINKGTGVDDQGIGEFGIGHEGHAFFLKVTEHDFRIDEVLGAAKGNESNLGRHGNGPEIGRDLDF